MACLTGCHDIAILVHCFGVLAFAQVFMSSLSSLSKTPSLTMVRSLPLRQTLEWIGKSDYGPQRKGTSQNIREPVCLQVPLSKAAVLQ
ncbi:hypothetical protein HDK77DRAFT_124088 [Phyllosticta capitalensis]